MNFEMMPYEDHKQFWDELEELWTKDSVERLYLDAQRLVDERKPK